MSKKTKRQQALAKLVTPGKAHSLTDALSLLQDVATKHAIKFVETVELAINLGVDPRKTTVRGACVLPHGTGKTVRIAVFAQGANAEAAIAAGADIVGFEDLAEQIKGGNMDFDVLIATPDAMRLVGQLGQILGPRNLMPNPKVGTVTPDVAGAVGRAKAGQITFRLDKGGIVHCPVGKINFTAQQLQENIEAVIADVKKAKPSDAKGIYMRKVAISSTMGPGLSVDIASINA